jgi:hypothetical protein
MRERPCMMHERRDEPTARLHEISTQERARLSATWGDLPAHIFDQMVDRLARQRLAQEQSAGPEQHRRP